MRVAIEVAGQNPHAPFGTVLIDNKTEETVVTGVNQSRLNPVLHGEIVAINNYALLGVGNWNDLTLFTTAEPCPMCQAAIVWSGIARVIYGTSIRRLEELGWRQIRVSAQQIIDASKFSDCRLLGGVLEKECDQLFARK